MSLNLFVFIFFGVCISFLLWKVCVFHFLLVHVFFLGVIYGSCELQILYLISLSSVCVSYFGVIM